MFQGLFDIPQPVGAEMNEGLPAIEMTDNPDDLSVFLTALYDGPQYGSYSVGIHCVDHFHFSSFVRCAKLDFKNVAIFTRLGHKYGVEHLCEGGMRRLREGFPSTFYPCFGWYEGPGKALPGFRTEDAITVLNLARLTAAIDILPTILYVCAQLSISHILCRSTLVPGSNNEDYRSMMDVARCLSGQTELRLRQHRTVLKFVASESRSDKCTDTQACDERLAKMRKETVGMLSSPSCLTALVDTLRPHSLWNFVGTYGLCDPCMSALRSQENSLLKATFDDLPAIFNVRPPAP